MRKNNNKLKLSELAVILFGIFLLTINFAILEKLDHFRVNPIVAIIFDILILTLIFVVINLLTKYFRQQCRKITVKKATRFITINIIVTLFIIPIVELAIWSSFWFPQITPRLPYLFKAIQHSIYLYNFRNLTHEFSIYNSELLYILEPNSIHQFNDVEFKTTYSINSAGFRDDEDSLNQPEIIALGDSVTMGWGVEQNKTFPQIIEKETGLKTLNTGIASYGTGREITLLQNYLGKNTKTNLKYLIIQYCPNDLLENIDFIKKNYVYTTPPRSEFENAVVEFHKDKRYYPGKWFKRAAEVTREQLIWNGKSTPQLVQQETTKHVQSFYKILQQSDIDFNNTKIIIFSLHFSPGFGNRFLNSNFNGDIFVSELKKLFVNNPNIYIMNTNDFLKDDDYFLIDDHPNAKGHGKIAEQIIKIIKNNSLTTNKEY